MFHRNSKVACHHLANNVMWKENDFKYTYVKEDSFSEYEISILLDLYKHEVC